MPLYEYHCRDCDHRFEILQQLGEGPEGLNCPSCDTRDLEKLFSTFAASTSSSASSSRANADCGAPGCGTGFT